MVRVVEEPGKEKSVSTDWTKKKGKNGPESFVSNFQSAVEGEEEWLRATSETRKRSLSDGTVWNEVSGLLAGRGRGKRQNDERCFSRTAVGLVRTRSASDELPIFLGADPC
jgi:hypothetical protein